MNAFIRTRTLYYTIKTFASSFISYKSHETCNPNYGTCIIVYAELLTSSQRSNLAPCSSGCGTATCQWKSKSFAISAFDVFLSFDQILVPISPLPSPGSPHASPVSQPDQRYRVSRTVARIREDSVLHDQPV